MKLELDPESALPAYVQIRNQLRERIVRGDLVAGTQLPPERALARTLGISRTTVVNAYDELEAEGLVRGYVGRGTIVAAGATWMDAQPIAWPAHFSSLGRRVSQYAQATDLPALRLGAQAGVISFALGLPDPAILPPERLEQAWEEIVGRLGTAAVGACPAQGTPTVREVIAGRMRERGVTIHPEGITVVNGSQHGLDLLLRLLVEPGDTVLVGIPTYFGALLCFQAWGVRIIGVPVDRDGMDVGQVEFLLARYRPKLIYTVPTYQNPTGATMSLERRERLLAMAQRYHVPIVEDDPFGDLYFDEPPPPPIRALDRHGYVLPGHLLQEPGPRSASGLADGSQPGDRTGRTAQSADRTAAEHGRPTPGGRVCTARLAGGRDQTGPLRLRDQVPGNGPRAAEPPAARPALDGAGRGHVPVGAPAGAGGRSGSAGRNGTAGGRLPAGVPDVPWRWASQCLPAQL